MIMRLIVKSALVGVILTFGVVVCPISRLLKDTEKVNAILGKPMLPAFE